MHHVIITLNDLTVLLILVIMHTVQTFLMLTVYLIIVEDVVQDSMIHLVLKLLIHAVRSVLYFHCYTIKLGAGYCNP